MHEENYKVAEEIEFLKATVSELVIDNEDMKRNLDIKQNEWVKKAEKPSSSKEIIPEPVTKMPTTKYKIVLKC